jgi:NAD-dependent SIR2 family protein deacetylase
MLERAANALRNATALVITAGAGMGVDSGLPDFRGTQGFWRAYPAFRELGLSFEELANPQWFVEDPELAWGFYGHRLNLYRKTVPHGGFAILKRWAARMKHGACVFTSNVDGAFQRAGFPEENIHEVHGAIDWMQCLRGERCTQPILRRDDLRVVVDENTMRARPPLPVCPTCGALLRPNILMFGDFGWDPSRAALQEENQGRWLGRLDGGVDRVVVVECGAGVAIPTVRSFSERLARRMNGTLIRINLRDPEVPRGGVSLATGALDGLSQLDGLLTSG